MRAIIVALALAAGACAQPTVQPLAGVAKGEAVTESAKAATPKVVPLAGNAKARGSGKGR